MATEKQIAANRLNAAKSTGPTTPEGKARSSHNAIKHGLTAKTSLLSHEDQHHFDIWRGELLRELNPVGIREELLAHRIIQSFWRLSRAARYERMFADNCDTRSPDAPDPSNAELDEKIKDCFAKGLYDRLTLYETRVERALYDAYRELRRLQQIRLAPKQLHPSLYPSLPPAGRNGSHPFPNFDIKALFRPLKNNPIALASFSNEANRKDSPELFEETKKP